MQDAPGLSEAAQIIITLVSVLGSVVIAGFTFLGIRANQTRSLARSANSNSAVAREHVANSHTTNLRIEQDERHQQVMAALDGQTKSISGLKRDIGRLADADLELSRQAREDRARLSAHLDQLALKENK